MTLLTFLCQLISTTTFILMCHLILSKRLPEKSLTLYTYTQFLSVFFWPRFPGNMASRSFYLERLLFCRFIKRIDYTTFSFFRFYGLGVF